MMTKNLVICCDGTSNGVSGNSTNVLKLYRCLERSEKQLAYYDAGVGTSPDPTKITWLGKQLSRMFDMSIGLSIRENACRCYRFLCRHYDPGDRVYLFGFSRGAYTVRAVAGMVHFLGLVRPELEGLDRLAWNIYANDDQSLAVSRRFEAGNRFRKAFGVDRSLRLHFVGVWDTVSTFGFIWNLRTVPYSANNPSIAHVRHAVSIDERRACFQPNLFRPKSGTQHESYKQCWFAGSHGDVGGGYDDSDNGLSKIALEWMFREAELQGCCFLDERKQQFLAMFDEEDAAAAVTARAHNSTVGLWHLLEFLPRKQWDPTASPERMRWFLPNMYRKRALPDTAILHPSVKEKLQLDASYQPSNLPAKPCYDD